MGFNPELRTLFYKLTRLLPLCVMPVFVFDGEDRPQMKRGRHVRGKEHWMAKTFKEMISAFGFSFHNVGLSDCVGSSGISLITQLIQAPGEAEAELASLSNLGLLDVVMTDDSDVFVFGARCVIRNR